MPYFAHSGTPDDTSDWQLLIDHLNQTASLASRFAAPLGLERLAFVTALFHDLGKYDPRFQERLTGKDIRVDHSTAGAVVLRDLVKGRGTYDRIAMELAAYAVLGHHAGLPDRKTERSSCFNRRIEGFADTLDPVWKSELKFDLADLVPDWLPGAVHPGNPYWQFDTSVIGRMLFSCLVDADFRNTEKFYTDLEKREVDREWPALQDLLPQLRTGFDAHMAGLNREGDLNDLRRAVLAHARGKAALPPGLFTLTVPTGGGKTLASLGFALDHAAAHGHRRIIYSIPFTSIIDQTADIFRKVFGPDIILEHHSAIEEDEKAARREQRDKLKLAMEDWAAPVVVTTNVQFFESLFAARTSRTRKLHNIAGSIIILDEAQTIPRGLLKPCVRMLDSLARLCGCTIVLCTATQPALGKPNFPDGLDLAGRELAPDPEGLARRLRRTRIELAGDMGNDALVAALAGEAQALVIVNSRRHALELYEQAKEAGLDGLVHLTTRQCAAHRRKILEELRARLMKGQPCRVIATSLIEAGVDIDFPRVWRAQAGWDQIMQAAGRCNREGKRPADDSVVTVFSAPDYPPPAEIKSLIGDTTRALKTFQGNPQSLEAIRAFFGEVYWRTGPGLDEKEIVDAFTISGDGTDFAFRDVAEKFHMIESTMVPVIVPWDEKAQEAVDKLAIENIPSGLIARKLQTYIVQVPAKARELLIRYGHVAFASPSLRGDQFAILKNRELYRDRLGLIWDKAEYISIESSIL
ncbi:MAG: CRISPR-associated protein Cas3 [Kaistia sp. SCN 65-12]|nr:MAG: CRISPR-associated protein Cas3 [Kaistia sp. SCN 65-12]